MPVFVKRVRQFSHVDIAVEADNQEEAEKAVNKWIAQENNNIDFDDAMNSRSEENEEWIKKYDNIDEYNRYSCCDFLITNSKSKKVMYDLYFVADKDGSGRPCTTSWHYCTMSDVIRHIKYIDNEYNLTPKRWVDTEWIKLAKDRGTCILAFDAERRSK